MSDILLIYNVSCSNNFPFSFLSVIKCLFFWKLLSHKTQKTATFVSYAIVDKIETSTQLRCN